jgi:hypothetical protein
LENNLQSYETIGLVTIKDIRKRILQQGRYPNTLNYNTFLIHPIRMKILSSSSSENDRVQPGVEKHPMKMVGEMTTVTILIRRGGKVILRSIYI